MQKERLATLQVEYNKELEIIKHEFEQERKQMLDKHSADTNELADILFAMEQNFIERENEAKLTFQSQKDEVRNKVRKSTPPQKPPKNKKTTLWFLCFLPIVLQPCQMVGAAVEGTDCISPEG